ncbi:hypothetical protein CAL7716_038400 [Calothrix sp. PCC 7716]|nr:hypothetical protein CAL7716_038400 [Calothrix sp. PCC 7716]
MSAEKECLWGKDNYLNKLMYPVFIRKNLYLLSSDKQVCLPQGDASTRLLPGKSTSKMTWFQEIINDSANYSA